MGVRRGAQGGASGQARVSLAVAHGIEHLGEARLTDDGEAELVCLTRCPAGVIAV